ncbi:hypothetical protein [Streptomyces platensis]|uniref:hypothetical protein n=1 Tax=Streptomyces platensis TaxID=58346 RepID=UPI002E7FB5EE|nr:hypothetical protein [Streptomyces platensis]WUB82600.1 hypothetical protein OG424_27410 [Streptomyces platensis]
MASTTTCAWDDPTTRQGWRTTLVQQVVQLLIPLILFPSLLFATAMTPAWLAPLWAVPGVVVLYVFYERLRQLRNLVGIRRVLQVYGWSPVVAHSVSRSLCRFEGLNPDNPAVSVSVQLRAAFAGRFLHWVRWCRANDQQKVRFCGDPRFIGVVAHSDLGKGRMRLIAQREAVDSRMPARRKGVSDEARDRARSVGARVG